MHGDASDTVLMLVCPLMLAHIYAHTEMHICIYNYICIYVHNDQKLKYVIVDWCTCEDCGAFG